MKEITHEQATYLAAFDTLLPRMAQDLYLAGMIDGNGERTPAGCLALAAYRAEWVVVSRASLRSVLTDVPHEAPYEVAHVIAERLRAARSVLANAAGCVLRSDDAGGSGSEYVAVRREHLEELRDTAESVVSEHTKTFGGYPGQMSKIEPTQQAIAHANEVLEGK